MTLNELNQLISPDGEAGLATAMCIVLLLFIVVFAVRHLLGQLAIFLIVGTRIVTGFDRLMKFCHPDIFPKGSAWREWADTAQKLDARWTETQAHSAPTRQHVASCSRSSFKTGSNLAAQGSFLGQLLPRVGSLLQGVKPPCRKPGVPKTLV